MKLILVPHQAATTSAEIWCGVFGRLQPPPSGSIQSGNRTWSIPATGWRVVDAAGRLPQGNRTVWTHRVTLTSLQPGAAYALRATVGAATAQARARTLPRTLPRALEKPWTLWLGSCFAWYQDQAGLAGLNTRNLPAYYQPDMTIFCGDQVYLDNPWYEVLPHDSGRLSARLLDKYVNTWTQGDTSTGFSTLLAGGATCLLADDHEFWNNHPNWSPLLLSRSAAERSEWAAIATSLYRSFQTASPAPPTASVRFSVGPLDVFLADTRFGREEGNRNFMTPAALAELQQWLEGGPIDRPGLLVMGAPLFTEPADWFSSKFEDRSPANYAQYAPLAESVLQSRRALLLLAGDIHFGRLAATQLPSGLPFTELIASPLALVDKSVGGTFVRAPERFPARAGAQPRVRVDTIPWTPPEGGLTVNHFVTLGLTQTDQSVNVRATAWAIAQRSPHHPIQQGTYSITLPRRAP